MKALSSLCLKIKLMKKTISLAIILALSLGLMLATLDSSLESVSAQSNQSGNQSTGGQSTGGQETAGQDTEGIGSVQELQNLTGQSNETISNNTDIASPSTGMGGLEKEQTTDTGGKMTESDKSAYDAQQGQGIQQQK
jgi:hypothetical protein